jgi:hypothetical protein
MLVDWSVVGSIGTALAVLVAAWQVRRSTEQARTNFEDELAKEYRQLARGIPPEALLGGELPQERFESAFGTLYHYLDLTNQQVFLRMNGRIRRATWLDWRDGIRSNLERPTFAAAWQQVKSRSCNFQELRRLENSGFEDDPIAWVTRVQRFKRWMSA